LIRMGSIEDRGSHGDGSRRTKKICTDVGQMRRVVLASGLLCEEWRRSVRSVHMRFTDEHDQLRRTVREFVEKEINPHIDEWEKAGAFPAHQLFKKAGNLGLLGINKPEAYGGMGLDYSYQMVATEEMG